jgi:hypothetical protein
VPTTVAATVAATSFYPAAVLGSANAATTVSAGRTDTAAATPVATASVIVTATVHSPAIVMAVIGVETYTTARPIFWEAFAGIPAGGMQAASAAAPCTATALSPRAGAAYPAQPTTAAGIVRQ